MDPELAVFVAVVGRYAGRVSADEVDRQLTNRDKLTLKMTDLTMPDMSSREAFEIWADDAAQQLNSHSVGR